MGPFIAEIIYYKWHLFINTMHKPHTHTRLLFLTYRDTHSLFLKYWHTHIQKTFYSLYACFSSFYSVTSLAVSRSDHSCCSDDERELQGNSLFLCIPWVSSVWGNVPKNPPELQFLSLECSQCSNKQIRTDMVQFYLQGHCIDITAPLPSFMGSDLLKHVLHVVEVDNVLKISGFSYVGRSADFFFTTCKRYSSVWWFI